MRPLSFLAAVLTCAAVSGASGTRTALAADAVSTNVVVTAQFSSRTSLRVSTDVLKFDDAASGGLPTAAVDFSAGARTHSGGEVMLSVERRRSTGGSGDRTEFESVVSFAGRGNGTLDGSLHSASSRAVAGRWTGSGLRHGRLVFALHGGAPGTHIVPVRFILSAP
jgi:hypothetical protein